MFMKKLITIVILLYHISSIYCTWTQLGQDIEGESAGDQSGRSVSLSADGTIVAIGAYGNDGNGSDSGHVRIFNFVEDKWMQKGGDIDGESAGDFSGIGLSLSADGSIVAIGAHRNYGNGGATGHVRIFNFVEDKWMQKGGDIDGESVDDQSGRTVSLSADGTIVAIGAIANDGNGSVSGHVRIFNFVEDKWMQKGGDIDGESAFDYSGQSVSLSADGTIVAIGAYGNKENGSFSGHVRIYNFVEDKWMQKGGDIDGESAGDYSGMSVSLSADGTIVAIGAIANNGNGSGSGHVRIFNFVEDKWMQKGGDIDGESVGDQSGQSVSLSADGTIVAIGAPKNDVNGDNSGHVRIYNFVEDKWMQKGGDIDGESAGDQSGISTSLSADGKIVAIGAYSNDANGVNSGQVKIYSYGNSEQIGNGNSTNEQIGDAIISSVNCGDNNFASCYKVVHSIGKKPEDVNIGLMSEGCKDDLPQGGAIQVVPYEFEEDDIDFSYNVTVDINKLSESGLVNYNDAANSTGEIEFCTHVTTKKKISGKVFTISSRKFDYTIKFNLTADIETTFSTNDGETTAVSETLEKFEIDACVCSDEYNCFVPDELDPIEPNSFVHICLHSTNPAVKISNLQMNLRDEGALTNYPVVNFGASTWNVVDNDLTIVTEKVGTVKVSTVVIFDLFAAGGSNDVIASGSALLEFVDESQRTTTFSSFSVGLSLVDIDVKEGGCTQRIVEKMISMYH